MAENEELKKLQLKSDKKILENPLIGSLVVPIAIVLVGALVIFGVTKMLSTEQSYKDLVREMQSKTFGNKWVAALELSKIISSKQIPDEDIPWLVQSLSETYTSSVDSRTRDFVVVALGALQSNLAIPTLKIALKDIDPNVRFHAVVALGNLPVGSVSGWEEVQRFLKEKDEAVTQAAILALGTHKVPESQKDIENIMRSSGSDSLRYAAATALISFQSDDALEVIKEVLLLKDHTKFNPSQVASLKINMLNAILKNQWVRAAKIVERAKPEERDMKVVSKASEVLNQLKN